MRTHSDTFDLGSICKYFGGGGHKAAAAFPQKKIFFDNIVVRSIDMNKYIK